ncbi:hypothetical protein ACTQ3M_05115 [Oscillospiraceae bacterium LCP25S3_E10]
MAAIIVCSQDSHEDVRQARLVISTNGYHQNASKQSELPCLTYKAV